MGTLIIRHVNSGAAPEFQATDNKRFTKSVTILSPMDFPVEGRPNSGLMHELRWYLEGFLSYPFSPELEHAERVQAALRAWGEAAFSKLFGDIQGGEIFNEAKKGGYERLQLVIASDDPQVLGWPWEAIRDPRASALGQTCQFERQLNNVNPPDKTRRKWPKDQVNILMITARPFPGDVQYRSISRPLVELIANKNLPAQVTILRPPTFGRLRDHLRERPNHYHIIHFDGHGSYGTDSAQPGNRQPLSRPEGRLIFEDDDGKPDPIAAEQLSALLLEHHLPSVVLNACQSAMISAEAQDPFASVATSLVKSGIRSVVAMAYSLYVSGAQEFLPAFYGELFRTGKVEIAVRAGRQQMVQQKDRVCARGLFPLDDWLVPVVYQQEPFNFSFATKATKAESDGGPALPTEASDTENPYGFIGRDGAVLALERAMRRPPAGLLIQGLGGVGKTTLARGFLQWLRATEGLGSGCFWLSFHDIRSAGYVFNRMGEAYFGPQFAALDQETKLAKLVKAFNDNPCVIVWDNFETVRGIPGTSVTPLLSSEDQALLQTFLTKLRGGKTKVIITSRSDEEWLGPTNRFAILLGGLQGEERWDYCAVILRDLGRTIDRKDPNLVKLMDLLGGHPLAMRVMLPRLANQRAAELIQALQTNLTTLGTSGDPALDKLFATLKFVEQSLPDNLRPLLIPLALYERFINADFLEIIAKEVDPAWTRPQIDSFTAALTIAGLLVKRSPAIFELHPALTGYLRTVGTTDVTETSREPWIRAFVVAMAYLADSASILPPHEQMASFFGNGASYFVALAQAERLKMDVPYLAILRSLARHAQCAKNLGEAEHLFTQYAKAVKAGGDLEGEATAYHQLGMIAQERHNLEAAEEWYHKAIEIENSRGAEHLTALTSSQMGAIFVERRDFNNAEPWYRKAIEILDRKGDEQNSALASHSLGVIAQERGDFKAAEVWYHKALEVLEKPGNEHLVAKTYYQLALLAFLQRDLNAAERWYGKALKISEERLGSDEEASLASTGLGMIAFERRDFDAADRWYLKAIEIAERQGNERQAAIIYCNLGALAQARRDFVAAEQWHLKALDILKSEEDKPFVATIYHDLGMIAQEKADLVGAEAWYGKSLAISERQGNETASTQTYLCLGKLAELKGDFDGIERWCRKALEISERLRNEYLASCSYHGFGLVAQHSGNFDEAERWYRKSLEISERQGNPYGFAYTYRQMGILAQDRHNLPEAERYFLKSLETWVKFGDKYYESLVRSNLDALRDITRTSLPLGPKPS